ncbi:hypothetical protein EDM52_10900 [Brevibacillus invocatus]|uniref:Uncharacterized protein n=1 Tax=Brevibacillus invocatus TaxID=173959 RepID=A0A3M8CEM8_9BACL|nr:hypothetical protein [Brevibacillus invocatus]RNB74162.1 hypothetical protein EDM52_10900 [Brevibacillus invocatus]
MSGDFVADLLGKLSKRTGREWTLTDIMKLAEKMPKDGTQNIDSLLKELSNMGLDVPEETKEKVKSQMKDGKSISLDELGKLLPKDVKAKSDKSRKASRASGKSKHLSLAQKVKKLSGGKKKKR